MALEDRLAALETAQRYNATQAAIQAVQAKYLTQFRQLSVEHANVASSQEATQLRQDNEALLAKIKKAEYRVEHMVASMQKLYDENKQLAKQPQ